MGLIFARCVCLAALLGTLLGGCGNSSSASIGLFTAANQVGTWTGTWTNLTFGSSGTALAVVTMAGGQYTINLDLGGGVFGGVDPPNEVFTATINTTSADLDPAVSPVYGVLTGKLNVANILTISGSAIPGSVDAFSATGAWTTATINLTVVIRFDDGSSASAAATLTKN